MSPVVAARTNGRFKPVIGAVFTLVQVADAHEASTCRRLLGKVILRVR